MKIFSTYTQALRFAFALQAAPGEGGASHASMVKLALNQAGADVPGVLLDGATLGMIGQFAAQLRDAVTLGLPRYEGLALVATYSHDWDARRAAVDVLQPFFRAPLRHVADDPKLVDKMVTRHYIAQRERGEGWGIDDIARELRVAVTRVANLGATIETIARGVEEEALAMLEQRLALPTLEAAHA